MLKTICNRLLAAIALMVMSTLASAADSAGAGSPNSGLNEPLSLSSAMLSPAEQAHTLTAIEQIESAWLTARDSGKTIMLVLGSEVCDRCVLLQRYIDDKAMRARLDSRFVVLSIDVANSDFSINIQGAGKAATEQEGLPAIVLIDTSMPFEATMQPEQLLAFLPEPYEPLYQWIENILYFTERSVAAI